MLEKLKNFFINKLYKSCQNELIFNRDFYSEQILSDKGKFKDLPPSERRYHFEKEVFAHIPYDAFEIYYKKFGKDFSSYLISHAFGYSTSRYYNRYHQKNV